MLSSIPMRAQDLKYPFSWDERHVTIADGVWYVPQQVDDYKTFPFLGWHDLFGNSNPVHIEYCSGNGAWITDRAKKNPQINWLAIEKKFERAKKIWAKGKRSGLENLKTLCGEGFLATRCYFPPASIDHIYINFPDPWPKGRHAKHRIIQLSFVEELHRILKPGGGVTIVTDDIPYSEQIIAVFQEFPMLESEIPAPYYALEREGYGTSYFEELWRSRGLEIRYHQYRKKG